VDGNPSDTGTIYYDDGTISVIGPVLSVGAPYNQTYNLRSIVGTSFGKDESDQGIKSLWLFLSFFGLLFGFASMQSGSPILGLTVLAGSGAIMYKTWRSFRRPYVEIKCGGLNNQMLYMKRIDQAEGLASAINMAIQDMHAPPESGQFVAPTPIFPSPVFSRN
jgi:hypothetical protein